MPSTSLCRVQGVYSHSQVSVLRLVSLNPPGCELAFFLSPGQAPLAEPSSPGPLEPEKGERRLGWRRRDRGEDVDSGDPVSGGGSVWIHNRRI